MMIYYNTDVEVKQGDYIMCSGYIDSVTEYKNAYDAKLYAPLVISSDLVKATYIDVMSPTTATITPENLKQEKYGYSISIDKIEFAEKETRVYATVKNNGKALLNIGDAVIVQNGKQYNSTDNYEADYEEIPYEIVTGVSSSGIIVFSAINANDFELTINIHSNDYTEEIDNFTFKILKAGDVVEKPAESNPNQNNTSTLKPSNPNTQKSNNKEKALQVAQGLCNEDDGIGVRRTWLKGWLIQTEGFSESAAEYAVEKVDYDWYYAALYYANTYKNWGEDISIIPSLLLDDGYTEDEVNYACENANWSKNSNTSAATPNTSSNNRGDEAIETARTLAYYHYEDTPVEIQQRLISEEGFAKEDAEYCVSKVDNTALIGSKYNWAERVEFYVTYRMQDYYIKYTWCNECGEVYGVYNMKEKCPICGHLILCSPQSAFGYTKAEVSSKLKAEGCSDSDIQNGLSKIPEDKFYDESKYKKP